MSALGSVRTMLLLLPMSVSFSYGADYWFGPFRQEIESRALPVDVVIGNGVIYTANSGTGTVSMVEASGKTLGIIEHLLQPSGLAFFNQKLWVSDAGSHTMHVYDSQGKLLQSWGQDLQGELALCEPAGLALTSHRVYVADQGNNRVCVFDHSGKALGQLPDPKDKPLKRPADVVVTADGSLFVADMGNNRVVAYDPSGQVTRVWGDWGAFPGLFDGPIRLVWSADRLLVMDHRNHRVQAFSADGTFLGLWGEHSNKPHEGGGNLHYPNALAIEENGTFAVICEAIEDRLQIFDPHPEGITDPGLGPPQEERFHLGKQIKIDDGIMVVAEPEKHNVLLFDLRSDIPVNITKFGERGEGYGLMMHTSGLWLNVAAKQVMLSDLASGRLQEFQVDFDPKGPPKYRSDMTQFVGSFESIGLTEEAQPRKTPRLTVLDADPSGRFYLIDERNACVYVLDKDWQYQYTLKGKKRRPLLKPTDLAFGKKWVYVVDQLAGSVIVFNYKGKQKFRFGTGAGAGKLGRPVSVALDSAGKVYVSDSIAHRIVKYTAKGKYITHWGGLGDEMGKLWYPAGVAIDGRDRVVVVDYGNHRLQIFDQQGVWRVTQSASRAFTWKRPPRPRPATPGGKP